MTQTLRRVSTDLVPVDNELVKGGDRAAVLARLTQAAENVASPDEAYAIMKQGRVVSEALTLMRAPFEEAWIAGKASVLAGRKLGQMLTEISSEPVSIPGKPRRGPSLRALIARELGLGDMAKLSLVRLAAIPDPDFQRYIQKRDRIPSINGAKVHFELNPPSQRVRIRQSSARRKRANITTPANPSFDEAYSLIVKALGHLGGVAGGDARRTRAIGQAMTDLYEAEDLLRPFRGGY